MPLINATETVDRTLEQILEGENAGDLLKALNSVERAMLDQLVVSMHSGGLGHDKRIEELWKVDYIRRPPSMLEFIEDEYWLGQVLRPSGDNEGIFPKWREVLLADFDLDSRIHNAVFTGSLGTGKSFITGVVVLFRIALARLLRNPQNFFGMSKGSRIYYSVLSVTRATVRETVFGDVMNFMAQSPFFVEECNYNPDSKHTDNIIDLGNSIFINSGSKGWHVIGKNMMGILLDEGNFRLEKNPNLKAYELYSNVKARIRGRFQKIKGFLPAISMLSSSAADESSFTAKVVKEIAETNEPHHEKVYSFPVYVVRRHGLKLGPCWFKVSYGLKNIDPYVLRGWYLEDGRPCDKDGQVVDALPEIHEDPPQGASVVLVPDIYYDLYRRNCKSSLMDISGVSVGGSHKLFSSTIDLERCIELSVADQVVNPCRLKLVPLSMEDDKQLWDYLDHPRFLTRRYSQVLPLRHPEAPRFGHVDLATQSMCGVSVCHLVGQTQVEDHREGHVFKELRLIVEYDFILTIVAGETKPISIEKVQNFFFWLRDYCGYRFGKVTYDQWQSASSLQMMESRGFEVGQQSMDRTKTPYYELRSAVQELRLRFFRQDQLMLELEELLDLPDHVQHPESGCFVGETAIPLLDGTVTTLKELADQGKDHIFWVYSNDGRGNIVPGLGKNARKMASVKSLIRVTLDNGHVELCTPEHLWMLRDGTYVQAKFLTKDTRLFPLYRRKCPFKYVSGKVSLYEQVKTGPDWRWKATHKVVANSMDNTLEVVHHVNFKTLDNSPENLRWLTRSEHNSLHAFLSRIAHTPEAEKKRRETWKKRYDTPEYRDKCRERAKRGHKNMDPETRAVWLCKMSESRLGKPISEEMRQKLCKTSHFHLFNKSDEQRKRSSEWAKTLNKIPRTERHKSRTSEAVRRRWARVNQEAFDKVSRHPTTLTPIEAAKLFGGCASAWRQRFKKWGLSNHKVLSVELIESEDCSDVYDIEVEKYHNFALQSGVFVHNSKDSADSFAGAYTAAIMSKEKSITPYALTANALHGTSELDVAENEAPITIPIPRSIGHRPNSVFDA